jgi:hypothetical protein
MSQHDYNIANAAGAAVRADINNALGAAVSLNSGATAPSTTFAYMLWADTTSVQLKRRNAANSDWIVLGSLDTTFVISRASNTILTGYDRGKTLIATSGFTQTLTAAATLADGWFIDIIIDSGVTLVLDPNSTETIDGAATKSIVGPAQGRIVCNGTLFRTIGFPGSAQRVLISTATASSSASLDFTGLTGYDSYDFELELITPATDAVNLNMRVSVNNGSSYLSAN